MTRDTDVDDPNRSETGADRDNTSGGLSRRTAVQLGAGALLGGLAGCNQQDETDSTTTTGTTTDATTTATPEWSPAEAPLETPWTAEVGPENALPEYPRPQMVRERWQNLNGVWEFAPAERGEEPAFGEPLNERILVPYPVEAPLSGIGRHESAMLYRWTVTVPEGWEERVLLHFEAVDWEATVYLDGEEVAHHRGGYDHFAVDVTDHLSGGESELIVTVFDPTDEGTQPVGKQTVAETEGYTIFHTPTSGIWQTVWMEPVPEASVRSLDLTPDVDGERLGLTVDAEGADGHTVRARAFDGDQEVGSVTGAPGEELAVPVPDPHLWSPDDPFLYDLEVELRRDGGVVDSVESYFGMRSLGKREINGTLRPTLNGEFVFHLGTLDQGYWPDGVYTPPTDEGLQFDLDVHKQLGYNMVRKHIKVEPRRWFYHADRLGLLVWQDMPNQPLGKPAANAADREQFYTELRRMIRQHDTHPSVVGWVVTNEGWGFDNAEESFIAEATRRAAELDPERYVDGSSGVNICGCDGGNGDTVDIHVYPGPSSPAPEADRFATLGEYGGYQLSLPDHISTAPLPYSLPSAASLVDVYTDSVDRIRDLMERCGLGAEMYTSITDLANEHTGMVTYDRKVVKPAQAEGGVEQVQSAHREVIERSKTIESNPPTVDRPAGPNEVGSWPLDAGEGDTAADGTGENDGTLVGDPAWTDGVAGSALQFDGSGDYVSTGAPVLDTLRNYSVAAWVRPDSTQGFMTAVSQDRPNISVFFLQFVAATGTFGFSFAGNRITGGPTPEPGEWYHLAGTLDVCANEGALYVDGERVATGTWYPEPSAGSLAIGRARFDGNNADFWTGAIDQVHAFQSALDGEEVAALYEREAPGSN